MLKHCIICGAEFSAPPSANKRTCSSACSRKLRSALTTGKSNKWSERGRESARRAAEKTGNLRHGAASALMLPEGQRGPQNREAKAWYLVSPDGTPETVINLYDWARAHARDYFDMEPTDSNAHSIASGFYQIKRSALGKFRRRNGQPVSVTTYKGWRLAGWGDGNAAAKGKKTTIPNNNTIKEDPHND